MQMMKRFFLQFLLLLTMTASVYAGAAKQAPPYTPDQQNFTSQYYQALQNGPDALAQFKSQVNSAANSSDATDAQIAQAQMLANLNSGKTVTGAPGVPNTTTQSQDDFTQRYWTARDDGPDDFNNFLQQVQNETTNNNKATPAQMSELQMLANLNAGKGADGGPPVGFHGDPTDTGPSDWSNYNILTDANGNVIGFELKDKDQIDTNGDGQISDEELAAWKAKQDAENKAKGGPPGFRPPKPPPGVGPNGKLLPDFSLTCYECSKLPSTVYNVVEDIRCHGSEEGACTDNACPSGQECEQYSEKSDINGEEYYCHNCNENPQDNCGNHGFSSDGTCGGQCEASGGECIPVDIDPSNNSIVPSTATRDSSLKLMSCFACKGGTSTSTSIIRQQMCSKDGYSANSNCNGQCPTSDCEAVALDSQIGQEVSGTTFDANKVYTCYRCNSHSMWMNAICSKDGYSGTSTCDGKCPANDCEGVAIDNQSGQEVSGTTFDANKVHTCYQCNSHSMWMNAICSKDGYSGTSTCDGKCSASDCEAVAINNQSGQVVKGTTFDVNSVHTCYLCKSHYVALTQSCSKDGMWDDATCNGQCPTGTDCGPIANNGKTCYVCRSHVAVAQQTCSAGGYFPDASCNGQCSVSDCDAESIDIQSHEMVPKGQTVAAGSVQTCYVCRPHAAIAQQTCSAGGYFPDASCNGQCSASDCDAESIDKTSHEMIPKGQTVAAGSVETCYVCRPHSTSNTTTVQVTYVVLIIETPYERFVLNRSVDPTLFVPASVMALAKVDPSSGMLSNLSGDLKNISDFMGSFNIGFGPGGITTTGTISMDQLTSALGSSLNSGGDYGSNCFGNVQNQADTQASSNGTPTSKDINEGKQGPQDKGKTDQAPSQDQIQASQDAGSPAVSGPVVACGTQNGNKVLKVYDAAGNLVDSITQDMLKADPSIILEKLGVAQSLTDKIMAKTNFDFAGLVEKFTGLPLKQMQSYAATVESIKAPIDQALHQKKNKRSANESIVPNDPLYPKPAKKKNSGGGFSLFSLIAPVGPIDTSTELNVKDQYYLTTIGYTALSDPNSAWNVVDATQKNVVVAVVDSGLDLNHPDGPQYLWTNPEDGNHGWNFVDENADFTDYRGHGTFVAGIIAAKWNNGIGIAGINPGAVIMPIKVTDDKGQTNSFAVYRGINYAVNHGAKLINLSIGGRTISKLVQQAIERANAMGALVVIAAGNTNDSLMEFGPSSSKYALSVGMVDFSGQRSVVSSWGPSLQLLAPGEQIWSLCSKDTKEVLPSVRKYGYYKQSGTSFSAPMVTATASLIWAKNPSLTSQQVADIIRATATPLSKTDWDDKTGFGLLNASAALRATVNDKLIAMFTNMHYNRDDRGHLTSVDIYGTVRGQYKEFTLEAGRGKNPLGFRTIAGPLQGQYDYKLIARLVIRDVLRGSDEWVLRLKVIDDQGKEHYASTSFTFPEKR